LVANSNYRIQAPNSTGGYNNSSGVLYMQNPEDYVLVRGDFVMQSARSLSDLSFSILKKQA
jgi:hypothetical protein